MKRKGFTLIEILLAMTGFFLFMVLVLSAYTSTMKLRNSIQARTVLVEHTYYVLEKINVLIKDYVIDYEEYFNRSRVGCDLEGDTGWNVGINGYCDIFSHYGNGSGQESLYYCSGSQVASGFGCATLGSQKFGQYALQFLDVKKDIDGDGEIFNDSDDEEYGRGPDAIFAATGVQELYLISQDKTKRILIRRALIASGDWNGTGGIDGEQEYLYTLQMLKLRGFDAGNQHDFDVGVSSGVYDGKVDTWACDYAQGFICHGSGIGNLYSGYRLPQDENDGWVNLFTKDLSVANWNLGVFPTKNSDYAWAQDDVQVAPYVTIALRNVLYGEFWQRKLMHNIGDFDFSLQTMFSLKNIYTQ